MNSDLLFVRKAPLSMLFFPVFLFVVTLMAISGAPGTSLGADCLDTVIQGRSVCTANDVRIISFRRIGSLTKTCNIVPIGTAEADFEVLVSSEGSPDRYDIGFFMSNTGESAQTGSSCAHEFLTPVTTDPSQVDPVNGPYISLDGDQCGDLIANTQTTRKIVHMTFACQDSNNNGFIDISSCSTWKNNTGGACTDVSGAVPGTKSKCNCSVVDTDIPMPVGTPSIAVTKTPPSQAVEAGQNAVFSITVTNDGNVALNPVNVSDPNCILSAPSGDTGSDGILQPGEVWTYTCATTNVTQPFTNTVTATGTPPSGPVVTATASANVTVDIASIQVIKTPGYQSVPIGGTAIFTIAVTNTGSLALQNLSVVDGPPCSTLSGPVKSLNQDDLLDPSETWTYTCGVADVSGGFINIATVIAYTPAGRRVTDYDTAQVIIPPPAPVPTINEWGMIIFMVLAGFGSVYYLRKTGPARKTR